MSGVRGARRRRLGVALLSCLGLVLLAAGLVGAGSIVLDVQMDDPFATSAIISVASGVLSSAIVLVVVALGYDRTSELAARQASRRDEAFRILVGILAGETTATVAADVLRGTGLAADGSCSGFRFRGLDLTGVDLSGADLRFCDFTDATLRDAILRDANVDGALFIRATLAGADLDFASARGAVFEDARHS